MLIWGIRTKIINGQEMQSIKCPSCGKSDFAVAGVIRYIHLFWIPLFVVSKKLTFPCRQCGITLTKNELDSDFIGMEKKRIFTPGKTLPLNFGLLLTGVVVLSFLILVLASF